MTLKRIFDIIVASIALLVLIPVFAAIALAVKLDSRGPTFYRARRIGRGGGLFHMYKFRTMHVNADRAGPGLTYKDDPRITRVGRLLRRLRLDELPQLINVVLGDMSLVGPRPEAPEYVRLDQQIWRQVLSVQPGICGLAQLSFALDETALLRDGATAAEIYLAEILPAKLQLDLRYINTRSLVFDLKLLAQTALMLVRPQWEMKGKHMSHLRRRSLQDAMPLMLLDAISVVLSFWLALAFRFDGSIPAADTQLLMASIPAIVCAFVSANLLLGLYRHVWRFTSAHEVLVIGVAAASSTLALTAADLLFTAGRPVPISVVGLGGIFSCGLFVVVRYRQRLITGLMGHLQRIVGSPNRERVLIVGAGAAGHFLAQQIAADVRSRRYELVGFVDDDPRKQDRHFSVAWVLGDRSAIPRIVDERDVNLIIIAIHQISGALLRDLLSICLTTRAKVKILPDFLGAMQQPNGALPLRDIGAEDLLGREICEVDKAACRHIIAGKVVLVTGAAGSIGSELCRQILALGPRALLMVDNNETGLHDLSIALHCQVPDQVKPIVADVSNQPRLETIFARHRPQVVFHAAAYKHVPMMEHHPDEAVRVNVLGTAVVADLAAHYAVERFVFISTDKAVNPSSVMGATKRVGELLMMQAAERVRERDASARFAAVRFGNVLGSRGSVAPTFVRQIEQGGPVTITHPDMTRFFISLSEAVSLVIQAATLTDGGDIFMLDMGQAIRIEDLAHKMIRLRGLRPGADIEIVYSGVRPGEKLHEQLFTDDERQLTTSHPKIFRICSTNALDAASLSERVASLIELAYHQETEALTEALWRLARQEQVLVQAPRMESAAQHAPRQPERIRSIGQAHARG